MKQAAATNINQTPSLSCGRGCGHTRLIYVRHCSFIILLKTALAYELLASVRGNGFVTLPLSLLPFVLLVSVPTSLISLCPFLLHFLPPSSFSYQQVTWMPLPEGSAPPGCPPGLEYLTQIDQILVHQQIEIFECKKIHLCTNQHTCTSSYILYQMSHKS